MKRLLLAYAPLALWAAAVLVVGALDLGGAALPSGTDKVAHFVMYGVGGALTAWAQRKAGRGPAWLGLAFVASVAAFDEWRQGRVAYRHADPWDWVADVAGALVFYWVARRVLATMGSTDAGTE